MLVVLSLKGLFVVVKNILRGNEQSKLKGGDSCPEDAMFFS